MVINTYEKKKSGFGLDVTLAHKHAIRFHKTCPICHEHISFSVEQRYFENANHFPFPHVHLHGNPMHAIIVYIDKNHQVRGFESVNSVQVHRDSTTFNQLLQKWSDPF
jgi:hypothetical protein